MRGDRPVAIGFGASFTGAIPFGSLVSFAARYGIDDLCEFDRFAEILRRLDTHELVRLNKPPPKS